MKVNYNGTATSGATAQVAPARASRRSFFFQALGADMVLNFGEDATASNVLTVKSNTSVFLVSSGLSANSAFPIDKQINVFCASATAFQAQAEE